MDTNKSFPIEIAYAAQDSQTMIALIVPPMTTIKAAIELSGVLRRFPDIDLSQQAVGIFGQLKSLDSFVTIGDRIEIYRPLLLDPKEARRLRHLKALAGLTN